MIYLFIMKNFSKKKKLIRKERKMKQKNWEKKLVNKLLFNIFFKTNFLELLKNTNLKVLKCFLFLNFFLINLKEELIK